MKGFPTASGEQSAGVSQVSGAATQTDMATPQNATLVEEMTASSSFMYSYSEQLVDAVAVLRNLHWHAFRNANPFGGIDANHNAIRRNRAALTATLQLRHTMPGPTAS